MLLFSAVAEMGTGLALALAPVLVVALLLGAELPVSAWPVGRVAGIALIGLGLASLPARAPSEERSGFRGMLVYNVLVALYLGSVGAAGHGGGLLLWPAVVLHALVALLLGWTALGGGAKGATAR